MKRVLVLLVLLLITSSITACKKNEIADLVVYGTIYTAEDNDEVVEAFAVKDGKYIFVGKSDDVKQYIKEGQTKIINIDSDGLIIPGCTEGHSHYFSGVGLNTQLTGINNSYEELLELLKEKVEKESIKQFISFGWQTYELTEKIDSGYNFADELEKIAPNIPVVLIDNSAHSLLCNTTALQKAGLIENPYVRGGEIGFDISGKLSGFVGDQAVYYVLSKVIDDPFTEEQYKNACLYGMNKLLQLGYTNALDAFTNMYDQIGLYRALKKMDEANELKINVAGCYEINSSEADNYQNKVNELVEIVSEYTTSHFNPGYIKLFIDGVVETATGWISHEYTYAQEGKEHGNIIWEQDELDAIVRYANSNNILIHAHTYGDRACKSAIDAYLSSNKDNNKEYRNCLAHVRNIQMEDIIKVAENNIPISENLIWHIDYNDNNPSEKAIKEMIIENIGEEYYYSGYPMKSLLNNGVIMSSSTDAPAAEFIEGNILNVIEVATTGILPNEDTAAFGKEELLTVREVLKALTINGAWQLGLEKERGSIKVGKYADFVILDTNILNYQDEQLRTIHDAKILNTYFEGEEVYSAQ